MEDNLSKEDWVPVYTETQYKSLKRIDNIMFLLVSAIPLIIIPLHAILRRWHYSTIAIALLSVEFFIYITLKISWRYSLKALKITQHGIHYRKESGAEGFIPWDNIIKIIGTRSMPDIGTRIYYFVYYKDKNRKKRDTLGTFNEECLYHIRKYLKKRSDVRIPIEFIRS